MCHATSCDIMRHHATTSTGEQLRKDNEELRGMLNMLKTRPRPAGAMVGHSSNNEIPKKYEEDTNKTIQNLQYPTIRSISMQKTSFEDIRYLECCYSPAV